MCIGVCVFVSTHEQKFIESQKNLTIDRFHNLSSELKSKYSSFMKELYFYFYSDCLFLLVTFHSHLLYLNTGAGPKKLLKRRMRRGREGDCWTGIDEDEDDDDRGDWDD